MPLSDDSTHLQCRVADRVVRLEFPGAQVSSCGGLISLRRLDEVLGLTEYAAKLLMDTRKSKNPKITLKSMLIQSLYSRVAGYEDVNDAEMLRKDPVFREIVGGRALEGWAASRSQMHRFETETLTQASNIEALTDILRGCNNIFLAHKKPNFIVLDMDSSVSVVHGKQDGAAYNRYFGTTCYHSLFLSNQYRLLEGAMLREGNIHSATNYEELLVPAIENCKKMDLEDGIWFRADAAFAKPELYKYLESENCKFTIRLPWNKKLNDLVEDHPECSDVPPMNEEGKVKYIEFQYKAKGWNKERRVIAKVGWHFEDDLFKKDLWFIVTNMNEKPREVVEFYNKRGVMEQNIKEGKHTLNWQRLSCQKFKHNEVRMLLFAIAYNLLTYLQQSELPDLANWSLKNILHKMIKTGAKVVHHARYTTYQFAEVGGPLIRNLLIDIDRMYLSPP